MVYWGLKVPKTPLPGRAILVMDDSSWHEELTGDWLNKSAYQLHSQQMEINVNGMEGAIDGIITDLIPEDFLYEHKAINHFTFAKYWAGDLPLDYFSQAALYFRGVQAVNPDIKKGILLVKNKNTAQYLEFLMKYTAETDTLLIYEKNNSRQEKQEVHIEIKNIVADVFAKFDRVAQAIQEKKLPLRQYDIEHWRCDYCAWNQTCWEGYEKEVEELKTDAVMAAEAASIVRQQKEAARSRLAMEKEEKRLKEEVFNLMDAMEARTAVAGEYVCDITVTERTHLDKTLLPPAMVAAATEKKKGRKLTIRKIKKERKK